MHRLRDLFNSMLLKNKWPSRNSTRVGYILEVCSSLVSQVAAQSMALNS